MREIMATGWMSNRGRQNVASYLTKDLGIDWRSVFIHFVLCFFLKKNRFGFSNILDMEQYGLNRF